MAKCDLQAMDIYQEARDLAESQVTMIYITHALSIPDDITATVTTAAGAITIQQKWEQL